MKYANIHRAEFIERPNRFIAKVELDGREEVVHVKNTGRCRELLTEGARVYLTKSDNTTRRTAYDLVAVEKPGERGAPLLINIDSQAPNAAVAEWLPRSGLFSESATLRREVTKGSSRFDFAVQDGEKVTYLEVKGVTLVEGEVALFPDAPTERGVKHVEELASLVGQGYGAAVIFVIQLRGVEKFKPNYKTHRAFGEALAEASAAGVAVYAVDCTVTPESMEIGCFIEKELKE